MRKRIICLLLSLVSLLTCIPITGNAATTLPKEIYIQQSTSGTCTLASSTMMLRSRMYLSENVDWEEITEEYVREEAWIGGVGLKWGWTTEIEGNTMRVTHASFGGGTTIPELKALLDAHPEGIVFYCSSSPHAVFLTDYEGDTFYCADPAPYYAGKRMKLEDSWLGACFGDQAAVLNRASDYWYISKYSIEPSGYLGYCEEYPAYCEISIIENAKAMNLPCNIDADEACKELGSVLSGDTYTAYTLIENQEGEYWYQILLGDGGIAYIPASCASYISYTYSDVTMRNANAPTEHIMGNSFVIKGSIVAEHNRISMVSAHIYTGSATEGNAVTEHAVTMNKKSYSLQGSAVDNKLRFGSLPVGTYTYVVRASYINYYIDSEGKLVSNTDTLVMHQAQFVVINPDAKYVVSFDPQGGVCDVDSITVKVDTAIGELPVPSRDGYLFEGWYTDPVEGVLVTAQTIVTEDMSAYARWACEHFYSSNITEPPTCTKEGACLYTCVSCGYSYSGTVDMVDHDYASELIPATCQQYEQIRYTCKDCGFTYQVGSNDSFSDWSETKPSGIDSSLIETKTEYRYADCETLISYEPELEGYTLLSYRWEELASGIVEYVPQWPDGFLQTSPLFEQYYRVAVPEFETPTDKTVSNSNEIKGYLYFHWCMDAVSNGPFNRAGKDHKTEDCDTFHAFFSEVEPSSLKGLPDKSYQFSNAECCKDTYWYYAVPVYIQHFSSLRKEFTYCRWLNWSDWTATEYVPTETRKVETRTLYRYVNTALADHTWDNGVVSESPTEEKEGIKTFTCSVCGAQKEEIINKLEHTHKYEEAVTLPTCTQNGFTTYTCSICHDTYEDCYVEMLPHNYEDGICIICGSIDESYKDLIHFVGVNMTLGNALDMNFFVNQTDIPGEDNYAVITKQYADGRADTKVTIPQSQWQTAGTMYYFTFSGVMAKEMGDRFEAVIYNAADEAISEIRADSIRDYSRRMLNKEDAKDKDKSLYIEMLNYGAAAQAKFNYDVGNLVNSVVSPEEQAAFGVSQREYENLRKTADGYVGTSLTLESRILFNVVFDSSYVTEGSYAIATFLNHNGKLVEDRVEEFEPLGKYFFASFTKMSVADRSQLLNIKLYDATGKEVVAVSDTVEGYVARMSSSDPLYEAIMKFADAAYSYFHN